MDWLTGTLGIGGGGVVLWILKKIAKLLKKLLKI